MRRRRVLLVDDSITLLQMLRYILEDAGYEVEEASEPDAALEQARRSPFDLAIVDLFMSGASGIVLLRRLRGIPAFRTIPILMLGTDSEANLKGEAKQAGATGWIERPFNPMTLVSIAKYAIDESRTSPTRATQQQVP